MTRIADVPLFPPVLAEIVTLPAATPVTSPVEDTVATALLDDAHTIKPALLGGDTVAVSWTVAPTATVAFAGETLTDFTLDGPRANEGDVGKVGARC